MQTSENSLNSASQWIFDRNNPASKVVSTLAITLAADKLGSNPRHASTESVMVTTRYNVPFPNFIIIENVLLRRGPNLRS